MRSRYLTVVRSVSFRLSMMVRTVRRPRDFSSKRGRPGNPPGRRSSRPGEQGDARRVATFSGAPGKGRRCFQDTVTIGWTAPPPDNPSAGEGASPPDTKSGEEEPRLQPGPG